MARLSLSRALAGAMLSLAVFTCAPAAAATSAASLLRGAGAASTPAARQDTCQFCFRQCPVACYVGVCGTDAPPVNTLGAVRRFGTQNQCFTCEAELAVGISQTNDYSLCSADESGASTVVWEEMEKARTQGARAPALAGDWSAAGASFHSSAAAASVSAREAAQHAEKAKQAANAEYNKLMQGDALQEMEAATARREAEQIRAQNAMRSMQSFQYQHQLAAQQYDLQASVVRTEQTKLDYLDNILRRAEKQKEVAEQTAADTTRRASDAAVAVAKLQGQFATDLAKKSHLREVSASAATAQKQILEAAKSAEDAKESGAAMG